MKDTDYLYGNDVAYDYSYQEGFKDGKQESEYFHSIEMLSLEKQLTTLQKEVDKLTELQESIGNN